MSNKESVSLVQNLAEAELCCTLSGQVWMSAVGDVNTLYSK